LLWCQNRRPLNACRSARGTLSQTKKKLVRTGERGGGEGKESTGESFKNGNTDMGDQKAPKTSRGKTWAKGEKGRTGRGTKCGETSACTRSGRGHKGTGGKEKETSSLDFKNKRHENSQNWSGVLYKKTHDKSRKGDWIRRTAPRQRKSPGISWPPGKRW